MATSLAEQPVLKMSAPDLRSDLDLSVEETIRLLRLAIDMKRDPAHFATALQGRSLSLLFEKPSLRTRLTSRRRTKLPSFLLRPISTIWPSCTATAAAPD